MQSILLGAAVLWLLGAMLQMTTRARGGPESTTRAGVRADAGRAYQRVVGAETVTAVGGVVAAVGKGALVVATLWLLVRRGIVVGYLPLTTALDVTLLVVGAVAGGALALQMWRRSAFGAALELTAALVVVGIVVVALSGLVAWDTAAPVPALRSNWLVIHVGLTILGELAFLVGFCGAVVYLFTYRRASAAATARLDRLVYVSCIIGYPLFGIGALLFGAIWAEQAWGRYWGWDPKETWALITWLVYTLYLHQRARGKVRASMMIVVLGFLVALFTLFGSSVLFGGLHGY